MNENPENMNNGFGNRTNGPNGGLGMGPNNGLNTGPANTNNLQPQSPTKVLQAREVPLPPKRSKSARGNFIVFANFMMSCLVLLVIGLAFVALYAKSEFEGAGPLDAPQTVVIKEGSSLTRIADQLSANGVIDNKLVFTQGVKALRAQNSLKAGEYIFQPQMSMYDVMETIRSGKGILHKVTLPEGLTVHQIFERIAQNEILEGPMPDTLPPEGSLMPDTYPFQRGTTRVEVVERMKAAQEAFLARVWEKRIDNLPISTPEELVTLASIVEKETAKADERPRVASVFINRLNKGMRLQSDPTIIYGIFGGKGKPSGRPIFKSDIETPTPYNTYTIPALPPGPIANPGRAAMEAVANPSRTEDLFFVANGTGGHVFAKTYEEHNQNVARWRQIEKQMKEQQEQQESQIIEGETVQQN